MQVAIASSTTLTPVFINPVGFQNRSTIRLLQTTAVSRAFHSNPIQHMDIVQSSDNIRSSVCCAYTFFCFCFLPSSRLFCSCIWRFPSSSCSCHCYHSPLQSHLASWRTHRDDVGSYTFTYGPRLAVIMTGFKVTLHNPSDNRPAI